LSDLFSKKVNLHVSQEKNKIKIKGQVRRRGLASLSVGLAFQANACCHFIL